MKESQKEAKGGQTPERYEDLVRALGEVVERLEGGGLSLEEAIGAFEQGIRLARAGTERLDEAERRVEQLLENGRTAPLDPARNDAGARRRPNERPSGSESDDIEF